VEVDGGDERGLGFHDIVIEDFEDGLIVVGRFGKLLKYAIEEWFELVGYELLLFD
jgi:hypothetical protein